MTIPKVKRNYLSPIEPTTNQTHVTMRSDFESLSEKFYLQNNAYVTCDVSVIYYDYNSYVKYEYLTLRRLMSYIYGAPILDVSRSHTTTQHSR